MLSICLYVRAGEPLCFLAFGPLATIAFYLVHSPLSSSMGPGSSPSPIPLLAWLAAILVGATTTAVLFCSHFHQRVDDIAAGKKGSFVPSFIHWLGRLPDCRLEDADSMLRFRLCFLVPHLLPQVSSPPSSAWARSRPLASSV